MDKVGERTLRDLLETQVQRHGDAPCLIYEDKAGNVSQYSYRQFNDMVDRAAGGFTVLGIGCGDKVTVHLPNSPEFLFSWFGLAKIGAVMVPSNTANTGDEMLHVINYSDSVALVTQPDFMPMFQAILPQCPAVKHVVLARSDAPMPGTHLLSQLMAQGHTAARPPLRSEDEVEMIFTSGTTSRPKGVLLTHANHLSSGERMSKHMALRPEDRNLTALPLFHVNAQSVTVLSALTVGASFVILELYSASKFWEQVRRHKATSTSIVPALLRTIAAQPPQPTDREHHLRAVFFAINVTDQEKADFECRFNVELCNGYGLSEAMTVCTVAPLYGEKRWPSIGLPCLDREIKIVDEQGNEVPTGELGEIVVKGTVGRTIMKGYYKDPKATAEAIRDGWLHTGDQGYMDEKGYVYFFDRKKDVIKRGAENVSASEVERVLQDHPGILEAAVIAVPDPIKDEAVKAFVVLRDGVQLSAEEILAYCSGRLAKFKVPSFIEFRTALPKTSIGKIEKKTLRAEENARRVTGKT